MFKKMKLSVKLICSFGAVSLIVLILGLVGYYGATQSVKHVRDIGEIQLAKVENLLIIKAEAEDIWGSMRNLAIPGLSREVRERQYQNLLKAREKYEKAWKVYEPLPQTPEEAWCGRSLCRPETPGGKPTTRPWSCPKKWTPSASPILLFC
ncbi:MAG: MCP four helix bundle domain-containing protein [Desulfobaccales bacterium]